MAKYILEYQEIYRKQYAVEADSYEEAEEKMMVIAENCTENLMDLEEDFDYWEVRSGDFGFKDVSEEMAEIYDKLPE